MSHVSDEINVASWVSELEHRLQSQSDTPRLDSQVLLANILKKPRSWVLAHSDTLLTKNQLDSLNQASQLLKRGIPLPYIIGHWEFYGLDFKVTKDVLIPRPETELLVDIAIKWLCENPDRRWAVDVATGSGCIAITLATKFPDLHLLATDISLEVLNIAIENAQKNSVADRITFQQADILKLEAEPFDLICANLPYIPTAELSKLPVTRHEPLIAFNGGADGLELISRLLNESSSHVKPNGLILLEIEESQGEAVTSLAHEIFDDASIRIHQDPAGHDRILEIQLTHAQPY